mgnify:CR=1 FL=1
MTRKRKRVTETYRRLTLVGAGAVTFTVLVISSVHLYQLSVTANAGWLAFLTPVAVDALGLTAAVSLWASRQQGDRVSGVAVLAFLLSLTASICGNILWPFLDELSEEQVKLISAVVAVYPAIALAISVELVLAAIRQEPSEPEEPVAAPIEEVSAPEEAVSAPEEPPITTEAPIDTLRRLLQETPDATSAELAAVVGMSASWIRSKRALLRREQTA